MRPQERARIRQAVERLQELLAADEALPDAIALGLLSHVMNQLEGVWRALEQGTELERQVQEVAVETLELLPIRRVCICHTPAPDLESWSYKRQLGRCMICGYWVTREEVMRRSNQP